jgi:hypothetical protein
MSWKENGKGQRRTVQGQRGVEMPGVEIEHLRGRHHQAEQAGDRQPDEGGHDHQGRPGIDFLQPGAFVDAEHPAENRGALYDCGGDGHLDSPRVRWRLCS